MKKITEEINEKIKSLYLEENLSAAEIGRTLNVSASTVLRRLKKMGVSVITHRQAGVFEIDEVIKLYKNGISIRVITDMFKSSQETISKRLKEQGIKILHSGIAKFNQHIFDKIDTEEKAY